MKIYKTDKIRFFSGLFLIILIYTLYYLYFLEDNYVQSLPRRLRNIITFLTTIGVYVIGTLHLGKLKDSWMSSLWHIFHIAGLCILTGLGLFDWLISGISLQLKVFCRTIQEILISPVLYVAMGILNNTLNKIPNALNIKPTEHTKP